MPKALFAVLADTPGGAERVIATAAAELAGRPGWQVEILSVARRTEVSHLDRVDPRISIVYGRGGDTPPSMVAALGRLAGESYDLVFSSHFRLNVALCMARRVGLLRTRRLVTRESTVFADRAKGLKLAAYRALYRAYGRQDEIWAQTGYMADRVGEMISRRARKMVRVAPNPVDRSAVQAGAQADLPRHLAQALGARPHIVWCGRFVPIKRPGLAVEALAAARRASGLDIGLVMVGAGPEQPAAEALAAASGLGDHVLFTGVLANPYPVFAASPLGLLTSTREGFPNVLIEMMTAGTPHIVSTACAGDLDTLTGVEVIDDASPEALGGALGRAALARSDRRALYQSALERRTPARFVDALIETL